LLGAQLADQQHHRIVAQHVSRRTYDIGGGVYNAFARPAINRFGLFDENIYPAFFEDNDFLMRQARMQPPMQPVVLRDVIMHHGKPQESAYLSGMAMRDDPNHAQAEREMRNHVQQRPTVSGNYVHRKWGCETGNWSKCAYQTPFNKSLLYGKTACSDVVACVVMTAFADLICICADTYKVCPA
jgi:hypothetical protein